MDVELKKASGGLRAYGNARSGTLVVTGIAAGCPGRRVRSYGQYEGALARVILLLKYERIEPLGRWLAERLRK